MSNIVKFREPTPPKQNSAWVDLVQPAAELAATIAATDFVPESMRNRAAAVTACILYGAEIGLGPMQALAKVDIIKGRPAPRAELARALVLGAGHSMWVDESTNTRVTVKGHRRGEEHVMSVTWTMDDVRKAGISNSVYAKYPRQMLLARASAELARMVAPDALGGIGQFAEELDDNTEPATTQEATTTPTATRQTRQRVKASTTAPDTPQATEQAALPAVTDDGPPPLPGDDEPVIDETAKAQIRKMMACFNELGIKDRPTRLAYIAAATRPVESSNHLTPAERSIVIDSLEAVIRGDLTIVYNDDGTLTLTAVDTTGESF